LEEADRPLNFELWRPQETLRALEVWKARDGIAEYGYPLPPQPAARKMSRPYWGSSVYFAGGGPQAIGYHQGAQGTPALFWSYSEGLNDLDRTGRGDWLDANGALNGPQPYTARHMSGRSHRGWWEWDITELARRWLDDPIYNNHGVCLAVVSDTDYGGNARWRTKEFGKGEFGPWIDYRYADGTTERVNVTADFEISGLKPAVTTPTAGVGRRVNCWYYFERMPARPLHSATLHLFLDRMSSSDAAEMLVGIFSGRIPVRGRGQRDTGSLFHDFERSTLWAKWQNPILCPVNGELYRRNRKFNGREWRPGGWYLMQDSEMGEVVRAVFSRWDGYNDGRTPFSISTPIWPEAKDVVFEWCLMLEDEAHKQHSGETGWMPFEGHKTVGFACGSQADDPPRRLRLPDGHAAPLGSSGTLLAGNGGSQVFSPYVTDGRCGWSARAHLGQPTNELNLRSEAHGIALPSLSGEWWSNCKRYKSQYGKGPSLSQTGAVLFLGRWHCLRYRMRVNTVYTDGGFDRDGVVQFWIDGYKVLDQSGLVQRNGPDPEAPDQPGYAVNGRNSAYYNRAIQNVVKGVGAGWRTRRPLPPGSYTNLGIRRIWHNNYHGGVRPPWSTYAMRVCRFACRVLEFDEIRRRG
jgi:hypothetical protein